MITIYKLHPLCHNRVAMEGKVDNYSMALAKIRHLKTTSSDVVDIKTYTSRQTFTSNTVIHVVCKKKIQAFGREYTKDYHSYYELVEEQDNNVTPQGFNVEFIQNDSDLNDVTVLISRKGKKWSTLSNLTVEELTHLKNELVEYLKIEKP